MNASQEQASTMKRNELKLTKILGQDERLCFEKMKRRK